MKNIGKTDKTIRIVIGIFIILMGFVFKSWWGLIGLLPLITAFIGVCPLYSLLKVSTCGHDHNCCGGKKDNCCGHDH